MRGIRSGVAKRILDEEPRAVYTHCYGHSINLAMNDSIKACKPVKNSLEVTHEITKLIKYSPRREAIFQDLKDTHDLAVGHHTPGIRVLCPTRWTVCANALRGVARLDLMVGQNTSLVTYVLLTTQHAGSYVRLLQVVV